PTYPDREFQDAKRLAQEIGVEHIIVESNELLIPNFAENTDKRCFYCKSELFDICKEKAKELGLNFVADGSNVDDMSDYRPGRDAAKELRVRSPLVEAGLSKLEIRQISKAIGLETWKKPSFACLSSRFPYGTKITEERLDKVEKCEEILRSLGFSQFRVRFHNEIARIEVLPSEINKFLDKEIRNAIVNSFKQHGFTYITLDLQGYRTGSMNENLTEKSKI
ncbi:MAG TPA: ATP-dependent sacrificial sulfur transferase LarE, partial [Deltaproteobacteria bacterium]|nr:ATP-dependent sacrificial sulfur transferase LarE [Deltaproteobacteria bacterium]